MWGVTASVAALHLQLRRYQAALLRQRGGEGDKGGGRGQHTHIHIAHPSVVLPSVVRRTMLDC